MYIAKQRMFACKRRWYVQVIIGMWLLIGNGKAFAQSGGVSHEELHGIKADGWKEIEHSEAVSVMEMIIDHTKGNYEKIRTWEGTYGVRMEQYLSQEYAAEVLKKYWEGRQATPVMQTFDYPLQFVIDMKTGSIYRSKENTEMAFIEIGSKKTIKTPPGIHAVRERSVVTSEHYVHFPPESVSAGFSMLPDYPEAQNKRAAFREPPKTALKQSRGDLLNPCEWFGFSPRTRFWEKLALYVKALNGDAGEEVKRKAMKEVSMYQNVTASGTQYKLVAEMTSPSSLFFTSIWGSASGFNPLSLTVSEDRQGKQLSFSVKWRWKQFDGIYLPSWKREVVYNNGSKEPTYVLECTLESCSVNHPIDPHQFDYQGLGLLEGDLVVDKIEKRMLIMKDGQPVKLANFGDRYIPPSERRLGLSKGWQLTLCSGLLVVLVAIFVVRHRKRKRLA